MRLIYVLMSACFVMFNISAFDQGIKVWEANSSDIDVILHVKNLGFGYVLVVATIMNKRDEVIKLLEDSFYGVSLIPNKTVKKLFLFDAKHRAKEAMFEARVKDYFRLISASCLAGIGLGAINFLIKKKYHDFYHWKYGGALGSIVPFFFYKYFSDAQIQVAEKYKDRKNEINKTFNSELLFNPPVVVKPDEKKEIIFFINTAEENNLLIDIYDDSEKQTVKKIVVEIL